MDNGVDLYRVLVCGGRDYDNRAAVYEYLDGVLSKTDKKMLLIVGGARGADTLAHDWGISHRDRVKVVVEKADWRKHGKGAGPIRNQRMLDLHHPHLVVAFRGGTGTANMIHLAHRDAVPVVKVGI